MRKLLTLILIVCSQNIFAQAYISMPFEDGMLWRQHSTKNISMAYIEHRLDGDTLIAGKTYKKVKWNKYQNPSSWSYWFFSNEIMFKAVREDTINKKVYAYLNGDSLIYDFGLNVGDTIHSSLLAFFRDAGVDTIRIDFIDSVLLNGVYHKRFNSTPTLLPGNFPNVYHYIEGIGSTEGFLSTNMVFEGEQHLICVGKTYNQSLFPDSSIGCIYATSIDNKDITRSIHMFPNPASDNLDFVSSVPDLRVDVIDILGRVIIRDRKLLDHDRINIQQWSNGLYMIYFYSNEALVSKQKLVKE